MKVSIEADSEEEFEAKSDDLIKALSKNRGKIRRSIFPAQNNMFDHWDKKYKKMTRELKNEISRIIEE